MTKGSPLYKKLQRKLNKTNMKTSKVTSVQSNGTWDSPHGMLYKFEYTLEDGTVLTAQHKTPDGNFNPGEEVEYEVKGSNDYGSYGKVSKPQEQFNSGNFSPSKERSIVLQSCLKAAATYYAERTEGSPEVVMEQAKIWRDIILSE